MSHWQDYAIPPMRMEAHFGDRAVRCFAGRPQSFHAMFEASLAAHAGRLADYKVPETVTVLDAPLPRNANGKLLKRACCASRPRRMHDELRPARGTVRLPFSGRRISPAQTCTELTLT